MAVTLTDNRTIKNEGDATTGWTAAGTSSSVATGTTTPDPIEASAHIVTTATSTSPANQWLYHTGSSLGTGPHLIYIWMLTTATIGTRANGGLMVVIGDGTNRVGYHVGGSDVAPFRSDSGETGTRVGYMCFVVDTAQLSTWPHGATVQAGSRASLESNLNAITEIGTGCQVLAKAVGGAVNYWNDIIRHGVANNISTSGITISGGTVDEKGTFREIAIEDRSSADQKAHGVIRELGTGLFGVQGTLRFGDQATGSSWFEDKNVTVVFENRNLATDRYKIVITDNGTGTTTFRLGTKSGTGSSATGIEGCAIVAPTGVGGSFDSGTDTDVTDVFIYGSTFSGFTNGIVLGSGQEFIGNTVNSSGAITFTGSTGATLVNTAVNTSTVAADASALVWNINADPSGKLDNMTFSKGTNAHHAIEFGTSSPTTMTLTGTTFTGFNASNGQNDSTLHIKRTSGTVTINLSGVSGNVSYKSDGATVVIVSSVPVSVTVVDKSNNPIQDAQTAMYLSSDNSELFNQDTDVNGEVSSSFGGATPADIYLRVRKSSTGTRYIPFSSTGTITAAGFSTTVTLLVDPNV